MMLVRVAALTKKYGTITAVDNFDLTASAGEILALVGPDGAGKTSLFRAMCGLLRYDTGEISIGGFDAAREFDRIKPLLGYMPQSFSLYPDLAVEENLDFYAGLFGVKKSDFDARKKRLYQFSGLGPFYKRRAGALSGGMKQKLALSCALVHEPSILILDEPTTGVDPLSRRQFWDILKELKGNGATIIVSTPYMDEVALADRAIFIFEGRKLAEGTPGELTAHFQGQVYRLAVNPSPAMMRQLSDIEGLSSRRFGSSVHLYFPVGQSVDIFSGRLAQIGIRPDMIEPIAPELEDTFIQLMGN